MKCRFALKKFFSASFLFVFLAGCNGEGSSSNLLGIEEAQAHDVISDSENPVPRGSACQSTDPNHLCLALKYVAYKDGTENPVITELQAQENVQKINALWAQCNLSFTIEKYIPLRPGDSGLQFQTSTYSELTDIRNTLAEDTTLLVVTTGKWNRTGSLGNTGANAWTSMPGGGPYGAILESTVNNNVNLISHELGHYLNLVHVTDSEALMNPIIYTKSTQLNESQCKRARSAAQNFWTKMVR